MNSSGAVMVIWVIVLMMVSLPLLVMGAVLIRVGYFPRRRGNEPRCVSCEYNLTGIQSARCPECGTELTEQTIVRGERKRRTGVTATGVASLVLGLTALVPFVVGVWRTIDWIKIKPDFMLMSDLASPGTGSAFLVFRELQGRDFRGGLSQANHDRLVELALKGQAGIGTGPMTQPLVDYLGNQLAQNRLTDKQKARFKDQIIQLKLQIRPQVGSGDSTPFRLNESNRSPSSWWVHVTGGGAKVDGIRVLFAESGGGGASMQGVGSGGAMGSSVPPQQPGIHELSATWHVEAYQGSFGDTQHSTLIFEQLRTLNGMFEVLGPSAADYLKPIDDPGSAPQLHAAITPWGFTSGQIIGNRLSGNLKVSGLPHNVAFDVFVRASDGEFQLGSLVGLAGKPPVDHGMNGPLLSSALPPLVDIILRSSERVARQSVDIEQFWQGELIFRDVPVKIPPTTQP